PVTAAVESEGLSGLNHGRLVNAKLGYRLAAETCDMGSIMVRKTSGGKTAGQTKTASPGDAKARVKSGLGPAKDTAQNAEVARHLAALHTSLKATAKTPDQRADVGVVGLAQKNAEQGDPATVGSLLKKLSKWAGDHQVMPLIQASLARWLLIAMKG